MKRLTEQEIKELNKEIYHKDYDQGIFVQPSYISTDIKGPVAYMRWESSGCPGSCWDDENTINEPYYNDEPPFYALEDFLIFLGVSPEQAAYIENNLIEDIDDAGSYDGYYGDYNNYKAKYVQLDKIYKYLGI